MRAYKLDARRIGRGLVAGLASGLLAAGALALQAAQNTTAFDDLRKGLAALAQEFQAVLKEKKRENELIAVGQFSGPSAPPATSGPDIVRILQEELGKLKLNITRSQKTNLEIKGEYRAIEERTTKEVGVRLKARLTDLETDETIHEIQKIIKGEENVRKLLAPTADFTAKVPPGADAKTKNEEVKKALDNDQARNQKLKESLEKPKVEISDTPQANVAKTRIAAGPDSPYALEVLAAPKPDKKLYAPLAATNENGLAFVSISKDQFYAVRCYNDAPYDALVQLTIDGVDLFTFSDKPYPGMVIPAKQSLIIYGWYRNVEGSDAFVVTEYSKSVAGRLNSEAGVGTLTASFSAVWSKEPPPDEPLSSRSSLATGQGPRISDKTEIVEVFRGKVRATISVRYNKTTPPVDLPPGDGPPKDPPAKKDVPPKKDPPPK